MEHTTTNIDEILQARAKHYGSYCRGVSTRGAILHALNNKYKETHNGNDLPFDILVMFSDLALKLMRAASDPAHKDSWIDLAGYAKLIKETMTDESKS